jgi:hypothetical protein
LPIDGKSGGFGESAHLTGAEVDEDAGPASFRTDLVLSGQYPKGQQGALSIDDRSEMSCVQANHRRIPPLSGKENRKKHLYGTGT